jgi:hypothetical protein
MSLKLDERRRFEAGPPATGWFAFAAALLVTVILSAQDAPLPVPQYDEVFYSYDRSAGKLTDLERQVANVESKPKALGFAGYKASFFLRGASSPVRFREGDQLEFVFSLPQRADPHTVQFIAMRKSGDRREFILLQSNRPSPLGAGTAKDVSDRSAVSYEIKKHGDFSYRLIPSRPLPPGEYSLSLPTNNVAYSFGIDGASNLGKPGR